MNGLMGFERRPNPPTKVTCDAFVRPGFMDSGWAPYTVYLDGSVPRDKDGIDAIRFSASQTEISQLRDIRVSAVGSIPAGALVVNADGTYKRTQGWENR